MREERIELIKTTQPFIEGENTDLQLLYVTLQRMAVTMWEEKYECFKTGCKISYELFPHLHQNMSAADMISELMSCFLRSGVTSDISS